MPYGDGSVGEKNWADLTPYENLILLTVSGDPRFCMNRLEAGGQQAATQEDSKMLDINASVEMFKKSHSKIVENVEEGSEEHA